MSQLEGLPQGVVLRIVQSCYVANPEFRNMLQFIRNATQSCKALHRTLDNPLLWRQLFLQSWSVRESASFSGQLTPPSWRDKWRHLSDEEVESRDGLERRRPQFTPNDEELTNAGKGCRPLGAGEDAAAYLRRELNRLEFGPREYDIGTTELNPGRHLHFYMKCIHLPSGRIVIPPTALCEVELVGHRDGTIIVLDEEFDASQAPFGDTPSLFHVMPFLMPPEGAAGGPVIYGVNCRLVNLTLEVCVTTTKSYKLSFRI